MAVVELSQADDGRVVTVAIGQQLVLRLPENPTTGYRWEPPATAEFLSDEFHPPADGMSGSGGERVFTMAASSTLAEAQFELRRPWGGGVPECSFTLRLNLTR